MDLILWVVRLLAFIGYATLSIILVTSLMSDGNCSVRHTYRQEFLAGFTANPFYSSTQIIRAPPSAYHMDTHGLVYAQHASDIGAFPVIIANPVKDAAFWPVVYDPDASLNSLYSAIPAGGIQSMLDAIDSIENKEEYNVQLAEDLKHLPALSAIAKDASNVSKHKEWSPEMRKFGSYHLMKNGLVVATDMPMPTKTTGIFTSMYSQTQHGFAGHRGGMLPNIGRCVGEVQELPDRKDEIEWLQRLAGLATNSHRRGSCLLTGQQDAVDVSSNHRTTAVWFTSLNMVYTTLVAVWISASFSLFLIGKPPVGEKHKKWMSRWESVVVAVAALWNVVLVVISLVSHDGHNIPMNNVFIGIILLSLAIGTQVVYSQSIFVDRSSEYLLKDDNSDDSAGVPDRDTGANEASHVPLNPRDDHMQLTPRNKERRNPEESNPQATSKPHQGSYMPISTSTFLEQSNRMKWRGARAPRLDAYVQERYVEAIQQKGETNQLVCTEYLITNPLLFVTILCGAASTIPTALVQLAFATMLLFHILCMGTLMVSRLARDKSLDTNLRYIARQAVIISSIACILSLVASLCIFVTYTSREDHPFSADRSMAVAVWVLIVVQCVFAIVIVFSAVASAYGLFGMDGANGQSTRTLFVLMYIMVAFVMRITIASIIVDSFTGRRLPLCSMWMEGQ